MTSQRTGHPALTEMALLDRTIQALRQSAVSADGANPVSTRSVSRSKALKRSVRLLDRALRHFRITPSGRTRRAVELSMDALQLADLLSENSSLNRGRQFDRWEDAWLAAHLTIYQVVKAWNER